MSPCVKVGYKWIQYPMLNHNFPYWNSHKCGHSWYSYLWVHYPMASLYRTGKGSKTTPCQKRNCWTNFQQSTLAERTPDCTRQSNPHFQTHPNQTLLVIYSIKTYKIPRLFPQNPCFSPKTWWSSSAGRPTPGVPHQTAGVATLWVSRCRSTGRRLYLPPCW